MKTEYFECICDSSEHVLRVVKDDNDIYIEVQLHKHHNIFKRMWLAVKYIFGYESEYGHWDCWIIKNKEDANRLINILEGYTKNDAI